uniref:PH domain-containing protein n=1 Tax=Amphiprion ocellaris TaxID=80972 RepID=A0A3Q1B0I6_AMPOC
MEAGEENGGNAGIKRQREPLSDTEENVFSATEANDGQKRRRLEASGQENRSPKPSSSGRLAELEMKPDTPMVPSVRSRVQQLTQRRDGAPLAQRCFSDPGSDGPSVSIQSKGLREHLLGEGEFSQRMERFKVPVPQVSPAPSLSPANTCPRTRSDFVSGIQQKLQGTMTPSSKQASRIRQEREQELSQLQFQPISENVWLKRSSSDSSLTQVNGEAEMKDGSFTETSSVEKPVNTTDAELSSHDDTNTADIIDQMFEEVLEYADMMEEERRDDDDAEDRDSGIGTGSIDKDKMDTESEKEKSEEEGEGEAKEGDEGKKTENNGDELLSFPTSGILSPLSKSVEAVVTPLRLAATQESNPPSLLLTPEETSTPPAESAPLYSIDAYRTQRRSKMPTIQSVTPGVQRRAQETSNPQPSVNTKEKIAAHNEEAAKLQTVINQTLQALSCCTDEEHGRGSLEEAEAEKLLLVSCEKRSALLAEVTRLREERSSESGEAAAEDKDYITQQPCRGTVSITNIQLPLKVEFVCSSHSRAGRPSHYFLVLIRYGPCNIVATPLATAADAQNGDTISFPTSVTLKDIRASFEIDVEVYSLSHTSSSNCTMDRAATKSRVTPRKLLSTITQRSSNTLTAAHPLNTRRSSNFCLVGSHKITLASLGHSKFPLDKMKLEGKIRKLLGDEFQEKVPFLSPLEGNIYLKLDSSSHSNVQHQGFLTMFELISGYGVWHRRYFVLEGSNMFYWNHPNDKESKEAEGNISLSGSPSRCIRPVKRDACARPFTFELVSSVTQQDEEALAKCWFSADTKQERLDWMEKLNQTLLDFHTWNRAQTGSQQLNSSSSLRESIL